MGKAEYPEKNHSAQSTEPTTNSAKPRKLFGPVRPFLVHLYLKTEKWIHLKLLV